MNKQKICAKNIFILMILFQITKKKEPTLNLHQKYFYSYHNFYNNKQKITNNKLPLEIHSYHTFYNNKQKGTSNKFAIEIFSFA